MESSPSSSIGVESKSTSVNRLERPMEELSAKALGRTDFQLPPAQASSLLPSSWCPPPSYLGTMMSPLNIHNPPGSGVDSTTSASHSPDLSKSPSALLLNSAASAGGLPLPVGPLPGAAAASLLHAFSGNSAAALSQMFPGFPLHMAAAAAAAMYGQHPQPPQGFTPFPAPPPPTSTAGQFSPQQQQQVSSLLAAARENQFLAQLGAQKKILEEAQNKREPMPPPSSSVGANHSPRGPQHPLTPLAMMARGQQNSPSSQNNQNILSPAAMYNQSMKRKLPAESADVPACPSSTSEGPFSLFHRMASAAAGSSAGSPVSFTCPICNISLDGVDVNVHFYEEMHKIDSLRKLAEWTKSDAENENCSKAALLKDGASPYEKFAASLAKSAAGTPGGLYQKKLQLPQSRWETFQRIRQNRHTRIASFMRFNRRKYEAAYNDPTAMPQAQFPFPGHPGLPPMIPPSHHSPSASSSSSSGGGNTHRSPVSATQGPTFGQEHLMGPKDGVDASAGPFPNPFLHPALASFYPYNQLLAAQGAGPWPSAPQAGAYPFGGPPPAEFFAAAAAAGNGIPKIWRGINESNLSDNQDAGSETSKRSLDLDEPEAVFNKHSDDTELDVESVQVPPRAASHCSSISSAGSKNSHSSSKKARISDKEEPEVTKDEPEEDLDVVSSDCESPAPESQLRHFSNAHRLYSARRFDDNSVSGTESVA